MRYTYDSYIADVSGKRVRIDTTTNFNEACDVRTKRSLVGDYHHTLVHDNFDMNNFWVLKTEDDFLLKLFFFT